jgi:NUMOD4 motif-containing protein
MTDCTCIERWLPVIGWENLYAVSSCGRVWSIRRVIQRKNGTTQLIHGRMLAQTQASNGYLSVKLSINGKKHTALVHDLVLRAFVGPPSDDQECLHGSANKLHNQLTNLKWGTRSQNELDKQRDGTSWHRNKTHDKYGHRLVLPNLVSSQWAKGYRGCLACSRTRADKAYAKRKGRSFNFIVTARKHYARIMDAD